ncbi:hypothetical protein BSP15_101 [Bacillus phage BSP15]|nr:hypothetical protein BSP15_101 [Bacillus phage BSP15]
MLLILTVVIIAAFSTAFSLSYIEGSYGIMIKSLALFREKIRIGTCSTLRASITTCFHHSLGCPMSSRTWSIVHSSLFLHSITKGNFASGGATISPATRWSRPQCSAPEAGARLNVPAPHHGVRSFAILSSYAEPFTLDFLAITYSTFSYVDSNISALHG